MDIALSGILTNLRQKIEKMKGLSYSHPPTRSLHLSKARDINKSANAKNLNLNLSNNISEKIRAKLDNFINYTKEDLCFSMQETVFAMLVEVAERALAHTGKKELLLGGGVACNSRLQEMCKIMCSERGAKMFVPSKDLLADNGAMIAYLGEIIFNSGIKFTGKETENLDIKPRERTDDVIVNWK